MVNVSLLYTIYSVIYVTQVNVKREIYTSKACPAFSRVRRCEVVDIDPPICVSPLEPKP